MSETLAEMVKYVSDNQGVIELNTKARKLTSVYGMIVNFQTDQLLRKTHIVVVKEEENPLIKDEPMCRVF